MQKTVLSFLLFLTLSFSLFAQNDFRSPVDFPILLSGNFGELRSDHFHSGIDIKTNGVEGKKVHAIESGYVSRIKIQTGGFGKALYINHPDGYTSVYAHLSEYNERINNFIRKIQYQKKSYEVDQYLKPSQLPVEKGEIVAFSGNTGGSAGPHLHFELRKAAKQVPLNVLQFGFPIKDTIPPVITHLALYPIGENATVNNNFNTELFNVARKNGTFSIDNKLYANGKIGFGIEVNDYLNNAWNRCGIFSIELKVDGTLKFVSEMSSFSFAESRFINAHIDYRLKQENGYRIQRLYKLPYDELSIYKYLDNDGYFQLRDTLEHQVEINVRDTYGNLSQLAFELKGEPAPASIKKNNKKTGKLIPYNAASGFSETGIRLQFPAYCFYEDFYFNYARTNGRHDILSDVYHLHNPDIPVHKSYKLELDVDDSIAKDLSKLCLVELYNDEKIFVGGEYENGVLKAELRNFGNFAVDIDTIPPEIKALNFFGGKQMAGEKSLRLQIKDDLSGIVSYNGYIDGEWVLFEFDPKIDMFTYEFDKKVPIVKKNHELEIEIRDALGNTSTFSSNFYR